MTNDLVPASVCCRLSKRRFPKCRVDFFDHKDWLLDDFADDIEQVIRSNDSDQPNEWGDPIGRHYSPETIEKFEAAVKWLRVARLYVRRIDYLLSGDDSEDSFHRNLEQDLLRLMKERGDDTNP